MTSRPASTDVWTGTARTPTSRCSVSPTPSRSTRPTDARGPRASFDRINGVAHQGSTTTAPNERGRSSTPPGNSRTSSTATGGDGYWNGGPWFPLDTLVRLLRRTATGLHRRQERHRQPTCSALTRAMQFQRPDRPSAPSRWRPGNSLLYSGQNDYRLQAAWPNAWGEHDHLRRRRDDAGRLHAPTRRAPTLRVRPKLPTGWSTMTFAQLPRRRATR